MKVAQYCSTKAYEKGCVPNYTFKTWNGCQDYDSSVIKNSARAYVFLDGSIIIPYKGGMPTFMIDVNGKKGPNKVGYDVFTIKLNAPKNESILTLGLGTFCINKAAGGKDLSQMIK